MGSTNGLGIGATRRGVAIVGAGPYGVAAAARLGRAGVETRIFGDPMSFWRSMPKGMFLRSRWEACSIGDQRGPLSLDTFQAASGAPIDRPVPLADFLRYAEWFRAQTVPHVDRRLVQRVETTPNGFTLRLQDGDEVEAGRVFVAAGIGGFARRPAQFGALPPDLCTHTSDHADLAVFGHRRVMVVGGGQSALESAALLREAGADVQVVVRAPRVIWLTGVRTRQRLGRLTPLFYAPTDVGPAGLSRILAVPDAVRRLPRAVQDRMARRAIRPAGAAWLPPRLAGVQIDVGTSVTAVRRVGDAVRVATSDGRQQTVDHVVLATGYEVDISRYRFLAPELVAAVASVDGYPVLSRALESSVPGLHFLGAPAARSIGPLMRFISGTWYAARVLGELTAGRPSNIRRRQTLPGEVTGEA
jgi:cation diffusion facilitator CzcD-associated flavoprotein CzcO